MKGTGRGIWQRYLAFREALGFGKQTVGPFGHDAWVTALEFFTFCTTSLTHALQVTIDTHSGFLYRKAQKGNTGWLKSIGSSIEGSLTTICAGSTSAGYINYHDQYLHVCNANA
ncbi:hypothetical protein M8818_004525 [Zalaria obscura]|uniref:Uncharacterized protein n=1 Tax=Zalaria obscura TaxID=2024903 RepID=A0ACC3SD55_9PEZI